MRIVNQDGFGGKGEEGLVIGRRLYKKRRRRLAVSRGGGKWKPFFLLRKEDEFAHQGGLLLERMEEETYFSILSGSVVISLIHKKFNILLPSSS